MRYDGIAYHSTQHAYPSGPDTVPIVESAYSVAQKQMG